MSECLLEDNELGEDYIWKNNLNTFEATFILFRYIFSNRRQKIETGNILILSHSEEGQIDAFGSFCEGCFNCYLADRQMFDFYVMISSNCYFDVFRNTILQDNMEEKS